MFFRWSVLTAIVALAPSLAAAQEFPQGADPERMTQGEKPREVYFPIGLSLLYEWPLSDIDQGFPLSEAFGKGPGFRFDAGIGGKHVGASVVYRKTAPAPGARWCPSESGCDASLSSTWFGIWGAPEALGHGPLDISIMVGLGKFLGEVEDGAARSSLSGWEWVTSMMVLGRLGGRTSHLTFGVTADVHMALVPSMESPSLSTNSTNGVPFWLDLGLRIGFD